VPLSNDATEALLLIDEPGAQGSPITKINPCIDAQHGCPATGAGGTTNIYQSAPNTYFGQARDSRAITFFGVPAEVDANGKITLRIANVRVNANWLAVNATSFPQTV
jgi:hypothetical protein